MSEDNVNVVNQGQNMSDLLIDLLEVDQNAKKDNDSGLIFYNYKNKKNIGQAIFDDFIE